MKVESICSDELNKNLSKYENKNMYQAQLNDMLIESVQKCEDELFARMPSTDEYLQIDDSADQTNAIYDNAIYDNTIWSNNYIQLNSEVFNSYTTSNTNTNLKYAVVELARKDVPVAVYVCGRMVTLGILGTDVECAFTGDKLVFKPYVIIATNFGSKITLSIEYDNEIQHYNMGKNGQIIYINEQPSTLEVTLVSTIVKKKGSHLVGMK